MDGEPTFGAWLKSRRRQLDLTQKGLAHQAGCSVGTIRKMEADERKPSRQLAGLLAECLENPPDQHEIFIAFARSEAYISETPLPVIPDIKDQIPIIPQETTAPKIKHNLPLENTPFVGREAELAELEALFSDHERRLVTIVGPGGIGKTRLALAYAARQLEYKDGSGTYPYKDGVFFVDLTPLVEVDRLVFSLAEALDLRIKAGVSEKHSPKQQILDYLRECHLLLVLDNFEQLLSGTKFAKIDDENDATSLVIEILEAAPQVRILVTSRERLNLQIEQVYPLQGLVFPDREIPVDAAAYSALKLFLQSAQSVRPGFVLVAGDWMHLTKICRLVEGMPLALELAASWVDVLSLADMAAEIQQSLDFLEAELRDLPSRHRSMRATFNNSWRKLDEREQAVFAQLSVFCGGFTRQAAQVVTGATLRQLSRLVNKSFIQYKKRQDRYQVHELLRQYGAERLDQNPELKSALLDRHSAYYCQLLADYKADLTGPRQAQGLAAIGADIDNVRQSWDHAINQQNLETIGISADPLHRFYFNRGLWAQAVKDFEKAIAELRIGELVIERGIILGRLLTFLGRFYELVFQPERASEALKESLDLLQRFGDRKDTLYTLLFLADLAASLEERNQLLLEGLDIARKLDNQWAIGHALLCMANGAQQAGDYEQAERRYQEALAHQIKTGDPGGIMVSRFILTSNTIKRGHYQKALSLGHETMAQAQEFDPNFLFMGLWSLGMVSYATGDYTEAEKLFQQAQALSMQKARDWNWLTKCLFYLGEIAFNSGDHALAKQRYQDGLAIAIEYFELEFVARIQAALSRLSVAQDGGLQAREHLRSALETAIPLSRPPLLLAIIATAAELFAEEGKMEYAALLAAVVINHPASEAMVKERAEALLTGLETRLAAENLGEIRQRSKERDLDGLAVRLVVDLET